jgi:hypothetical protein
MSRRRSQDAGEDRELERPYESYIQEHVRHHRYDILAEAIHKCLPECGNIPGETERTAVQRLQGALTDIARGTTYQVEIGRSKDSGPSIWPTS